MAETSPKDPFPSVKETVNPEWHNAGRVHDWRNHVPDEIQNAWPNLTSETRRAVQLIAQLAADREEWE